MHDLSQLAKRWSEKLEKMDNTDDKPIDPLDSTPVARKRLTGEREQSQVPISRRRSPMVNMAHVEGLFIAFSLEWGRKWDKTVEEHKQGRVALMRHWLDRMRNANLDEMSLNEAMARLQGDWPPSIDQWISLCRPHTYEARVGHIEQYKGDRPEPGEGYERFREFKDRHTRRKK